MVVLCSFLLMTERFKLLCKLSLDCACCHHNRFHQAQNLPYLFDAADFCSLTCQWAYLLRFQFVRRWRAKVAQLTMRQVFPSFSFSLPTLFCRNGLLYPLLFWCIYDFSDSCPCVNNFPTKDHHCRLTNVPSVQCNCNRILNPKLLPLHIHMSHY